MGQPEGKLAERSKTRRPTRALAGAAMALSVVLAGAGRGAGAQGYGVAPLEGLGFHDVVQEFALPPMDTAPQDPLWLQLKTLQVLQRATLLGLNAGSPTSAWIAAGQTLREAEARRRPGGVGAGSPATEVVFRGTRSSALNRLLSRPGVEAVRVESGLLRVDEPIRLRRNGIRLDLRRASLRAETAMPYLLRLEDAQGVRLEGGSLDAGRWGVLVSNCHDAVLTGMRFEGLSGGGVVITHSDGAAVWNSEFHHLGAAPVLLGSGARHTVVEGNRITDNLGSSNWQAGVVLTDRNSDLAADPGNLFEQDGYWVKPQSMLARLAGPADNLLLNNEIDRNASSGVYSDGGLRNVIVGNRVEGNSKEGLCLDNGSTAEVVAWNLFRSNGQRWGKSDLDLQRDFVLASGRLPDGTAASKVPGISIDNAAFNQVVFNQLDGNSGGGIKMVRSGVYNRVGWNLLTDNNAGQGPQFHFFGLEFGAAGSDEPSPELDFTPSRGNQAIGNTIAGNHYAGVFFAAGSTGNLVEDNVILRPGRWAMESPVEQGNRVVNNLGAEPSRNVTSTPAAGMAPGRPGPGSLP